MLGKIARVDRRTITQILSVLTLALSIAVVLLAVTPQGHAIVRTALFLPQILHTLPIKPQSLVTRSPTREEVHYPIANGQGLADLYIPGSGSNHSAVLLFLGVSPAGRDDPRVVGLADALARSGVAVMIPWSETMTQRRIALEDQHAFSRPNALDDDIHDLGQQAAQLELARERTNRLDHGGEIELVAAGHW